MSKYPAREKESKEIAELEWLEDSVDILVDTAVSCATTIFLSVWQLLKNENSKR